METNSLERGNYTRTQSESSPSSPLPSSAATLAAVLYVENEMFDQVPCQKEVRKKKASIVVPNGSSSSTKKKTTEDFDYHQRYSLPASPESSDAATWCSTDTKKWCFNLTIVILLLIITGLFTLPILFYYVNVPQNDRFDQSEADDLVRQLELCLASVSYKHNGMCVRKKMV